MLNGILHIWDNASLHCLLLSMGESLLSSSSLSHNTALYALEAVSFPASNNSSPIISMWPMASRLRFRHENVPVQQKTEWVRSRAITRLVYL